VNDEQENKKRVKKLFVTISVIALITFIIGLISGYNLSYGITAIKVKEDYVNKINVWLKNNCECCFDKYKLTTKDLDISLLTVSNLIKEIDVNKIK
jgi:hypothetical protein